MPNPTPICSLIVTALCAVLARVRVSNGYFTDAGADVSGEALFSADGTFGKDLQAIRVEEEKSDIGESNATTFIDDAVYVVNGYISAAAAGAIAQARLLRDDITSALIRARGTDFMGAAPGSVSASSYQVKGQREILWQPDGLGLVQVKVRVEITAKQTVTT